MGIFNVFQRCGCAHSTASVEPLKKGDAESEEIPKPPAEENPETQQNTEALQPNGNGEVAEAVEQNGETTEAPPSRGNSAGTTATQRVDSRQTESAGDCTSQGCPLSTPPHSTGILYSSPKDAFENGQREKVIIVTAPNVAEPRGPDALITVDVDPESETYCQVLSKLSLPNVGDEIHHSGWNACASCYGDSSARRSRMILPCLTSSRVYVVNTEDPYDLKLEHTIEAKELAELNTSFPHTTHCLPNGQIMISTLGDRDDGGRGDFILIDAHDYRVVERWPKDGAEIAFHYDFWYQPRRNTMISTEWGEPRCIKGGFNPKHVAEGKYGKSVHIWNWSERSLRQSIELDGDQGWVPLEVRFLHEPTQAHAFVGTALGSSLFHLYEEEGSENYDQRLAAQVRALPVDGWVLPEMPALITDIIVSMDDKYLYASCWLHGELHQYDISDPFNVKLTSTITIGGLLHENTGIRVLEDGWRAQPQTTVKGKPIEGGPQMLQLSLDGRRLYVTTSLYTVWDHQFYPKLYSGGAVMLQIDVDTETGEMSLNEDFLIDFSTLEGGPYLCHEMRYPGGDCTSDIWL